MNKSKNIVKEKEEQDLLNKAKFMLYNIYKNLVKAEFKDNKVFLLLNDGKFFEINGTEIKRKEK